MYCYRQIENTIKRTVASVDNQYKSSAYRHSLVPMLSLSSFSHLWEKQTLMIIHTLLPTPTIFRTSLRMHLSSGSSLPLLRTTVLTHLKPCAKVIQALTHRRNNRRKRRKKRKKNLKNKNEVFEYSWLTGHAVMSCTVMTSLNGHLELW